MGKFRKAYLRAPFKYENKGFLYYVPLNTSSEPLRAHYNCYSGVVIIVTVHIKKILVILRFFFFDQIYLPKGCHWNNFKQMLANRLVNCYFNKNVFQAINQHIIPMFNKQWTQHNSSTYIISYCTVNLHSN